MQNIHRAALLAALLPLAAAAKPLTVCTDANPEGFDVVQYNSLVTTNASADVLMNRLLDYDAAAGKLRPSLASSWEVSPDGLAYTFHLRSDAGFHVTDYFKPSRKLNADDVVFTFDRMLNPDNPWYKTAPTGYPHAQSMQFPKLIKSVGKVDAQTVRFELNYPEATFLSSLTMGFASIYSAEYASQLLAAGKTAELNSKPIGTGPFIFKSFAKDAQVRYLPNALYFGGKPKVSALIYAITPDSSVRLQKLRAGECQVALSPKPQDIESARGDAKLQLKQTPAFMTAFLAFNSQKKPLDNPLVRQAINLSFDKSHYLKAVFGNTAAAANLVYPPNTWSYDKSIPAYRYDPAQAKKLLAKAGYPNGFDIGVWVRPGGSLLNPNPKAGAELLQADLAKVGIRAQIKVLEWGELIKRGKAGEHELLFMGWAGDNGDPDNFLTPQFSCSAVQSGTNFARYCDPKLDKLIADGKKTSDFKARAKLYQAAQRIIHDQALWLPLAHPTAYALARKEVSGYAVNPYGRVDFSSVSVR
ncbi:ABC transporter substrate-binding protein [Chromobacterium sp. IIBBL 290-4]|uniref:ABC transporter substrate-binding protein n=1 Tax=Chromobacterium sp. IIBBL 290-4 TaxID=2953890 RepID=UPI0020B87DA9|nr:ABC transporter substrate-binding protein [Chromobacterium sp. IIBBL 290-4]UTH72677.1 ABC transporter substrate-binding protein [Chromobacterium sp. IIBBL 290-4]